MPKPVTVGNLVDWYDAGIIDGENRITGMTEETVRAQVRRAFCLSNSLGFRCI
jgi:hypothetical protein